MAGTTINMSKLKQVLRLCGNDVPLQTIAKATGLSRNTVKKYLRLIEAKGLKHTDLLEMDDPILDGLLKDPDPVVQARYESLASSFPLFEEELNRPGVNRWVLWGEYKLVHPDGYSYSQFCGHFSQWKASMAGSFRQEYKPGEKLFIDFTGKKLCIVDAGSGEVSDVEVYVAVLGFSQLTYVEGVETQRKQDFICATENAFHFFGGVTQVLIPDNLKSAVTKADKYEAEINTSFMDFANHYGTTVLPARSRKPKDKAHVEKMVSIVYSRIFAPLRNQIFYSLSSLNKAIRELLLVHNQQPFQLRPESRLKLFEDQERQTLMPLAADRYEIKVFKEPIVMKNGYIQIREDNHLYSVPYRFIGLRVKLIYTETQVCVFYKKERIAYHIRVRKSGYTTTPEHLSSTNKFVSQWNPAMFIKWAGGIAPVVKEYITCVIENNTYPEQAYRSCVGILSFQNKVGTERLIKAVQRATHFQVFNYTIIKKILNAGLDQVAFGDDVSVQATLPFHENIRGKDQYK